MIVIHDEDGRILQTLDGAVDPSAIESLSQRGVLYADVAFDVEDGLPALFDLHYVVDGALAQKPAHAVGITKTTIAADGDDAAEITGLPIPCQVRVNGTLIDVPDGSLTTRSRHPGTFRMSLDHWPYLPWSTTVEAQ